MKLRLILVSLAIIFTVTGCQFTTIDGRFSGAERVFASAERNPLDVETLAAGASTIYAVTVPRELARFGDQQGILYIEINEPIEMQVYNNDGTPYAWSVSQQVFFPGRPPTTGLSLAPQAIVVTPIGCVSTCVLMPALPGTVFVQITNDTDDLRTFTLFAYTEAPVDPFEPNNRVSSAAPIARGTFEGALETVNEQDFFRITESGMLRLTVVPEKVGLIEHRLEVRPADRAAFTLIPGESAFVRPDDYLRVFSEDGAGGPSENSKYTLVIN